MATVYHGGNRGNQSRPRELLIKRSVDRLRTTAERMGFEVHQRATKGEIIEMITTDEPLSAEDGNTENPTEPVVDSIDAEAGGEAE